VHDEIYHAAWGIPEVLWIGWCLDENHGSAPKHDQDVDVILILKRVGWNDDDEIQRKVDVCKL